MRLDKFVSASTGLSRKEAGRVIRAQEIEVNGEVCRKAATVVGQNDQVSWLGQALQLIGKRYLMLHKPEGVVSGSDDPIHPSVFVLIDEPKLETIHCVGRLDVDSTGLLLLTDDGQWSHFITSPKHHCEKTYQARLADPLDETQANKIREAFAQGVMLKGEETPTQSAQFTLLAPDLAELTITEGRYHQVKRMFAAMGNKVIALHRTRIGGLMLDSKLEPGEYRHLTDEEVALFRRGD